MCQKSIRRTAPSPGHSSPKFEPVAGTVTVTDRFALPPAPLQLNVKMLVLVNGTLDSLPEVPLLPDQPPEATHDVAFVEDQVSVDVPPLEILAGFAVSETTGSGGGVPATVTLAVAVALVVAPDPVDPVQVRR